MFLNYSLEDATRGDPKVSLSGKTYVFQSPCPNAMVCTPYIIDVIPGKYIIEAWGSGGQSDPMAGFGAYVKGDIFFRESQRLFLYIGSRSIFNNAKGSPRIGPCGYGASDVRIKGGEWYDFESLKSRIMVSGSGGSREWLVSKGGNAGALVGATGYGSHTVYDSTYDPNCFANGGTQTSSGTAAIGYRFDNSYVNGISGGFGYAGFSPSISDTGGVGGSGYYGGASMSYAGGGGGGSSYVSGHIGCDAILENSTVDNIIHSHQSVHYSKHIFRNTIMIGGNSSMPLYSSPQSQNIGNINNGAIRITFIPTSLSRHQSKLHFRWTLSILFVFAINKF